MNCYCLRLAACILSVFSLSLECVGQACLSQAKLDQLSSEAEAIHGIGRETTLNDRACNQIAGCLTESDTLVEELRPTIDAMISKGGALSQESRYGSLLGAWESRLKLAQSLIPELKRLIASMKGHDQVQLMCIDFVYGDLSILRTAGGSCMIELRDLDFLLPYRPGFEQDLAKVSFDCGPWNVVGGKQAEDRFKRVYPGKNFVVCARVQSWKPGYMFFWSPHPLESYAGSDWEAGNLGKTKKVVDTETGKAIVLVDTPQEYLILAESDFGALQKGTFPKYFLGKKKLSDLLATRNVGSDLTSHHDLR